jgi:hypothetical protein
MKKIKIIYVLRWNCDDSEELFETTTERSGRITILENQGYEIDEDFTLEIRLIDEE